MDLTLEQAQHAIAAAIAAAGERGLQLSIAVCDRGGRLLAFARMDQAGWGSVYGAQGKAVASAATGAPSGRIPADLPVMVATAQRDGGHMIFAQGAMPIHRDGQLVGAIGVGGARSAQDDEDCARAGADAVAAL
ncbi:MAG: heme-binding protein [Pseudomonas sp.]